MLELYQKRSTMLLRIFLSNKFKAVYTSLFYKWQPITNNQLLFVAPIFNWDEKALSILPAES